MAANDDNTIALLKSGDHSAYETVFKSCYEPLCAYACSMLHSMDEAEDVVQQMFCTLWDRRAELEVQVSLQSYLYRAVHNHCLNRLKHEKVKQSYSDECLRQHDDSCDSTNNRVAHDELSVALNKAVKRLPAQCRKVFELSRGAQLTYPEIAERLNISRNTVENHISKALRLLRESLKEFL